MSVKPTDFDTARFLCLVSSGQPDYRAAEAVGTTVWAVKRRMEREPAFAEQVARAREARKSNAGITTRFEYRGRTLFLTGQYSGQGGQYGDLKDDGIVDEVAVWRASRGDRVRLTPREIVCAVYKMALDGLSDPEIESRLGRPVTRRKSAWVAAIRKRHGIPTAHPRTSRKERAA